MTTIALSRPRANEESIALASLFLLFCCTALGAAAAGAYPGMIPSLLAGDFACLLGAFFLLSRKARGVSLLQGWDIRPHILVQVCAQSAVFLLVATRVHSDGARYVLLVYQFLFTFLVETFVRLRVGKPFRAGLSSMPIVMSVNLFVRFDPGSFWVQLLILATAVLGKACFLRRGEGGKPTHIFNPSALVLALLSVLAVAYGMDPVIGGSELGTEYMGTPFFDLVVIAAGAMTLWLPVGYWVSLGALGAFFALDGATRFWLGAPLIYGFARWSVLVGIMLLITDPKTSPRGALAKFAYGVSYALGVLVSYLLLAAWRSPTYYDKILLVPVLNLLVPAFERACAPLAARIRAPELLRRHERLAGLALFLLFCALAYQRLERVNVPPFFLDSVVQRLWQGESPTAPDTSS